MQWESFLALYLLILHLPKPLRPMRPQQKVPQIERVHSDFVEISMPFNARHNLSVGSDWVWQGDVHVFVLGEQVGRG